MKTFFRPLFLWLAIVSLVSPLVAQSVSKLELEKSSALNVWEKVAITPDMISSTGELLVPTSGSQQFYRMKVRLLQAPTITSPPPATTGIEEGESVTFTVGSQGVGVAYQWYLGQSGDTSQPIQGATSPTYNTGALAADTSYWVKVTNDAGSINSETVAVTINRPPSVASQPTSQSIYSGNTATLTVSATGSAPFTYQWYRGNLGATTAPVGTNSPTFTTPVLAVTTNYWVKITNAFGEIQSNSVTVSMIPTDMVFIPQGAYTMGDSLDGIHDATTTRTVTMDAFSIGKYEITKTKWAEVRTWALSNGYTEISEGRIWSPENYPVSEITWYDAVKWCNARSQMEGLMPVYYTDNNQTTIYKTGNLNVTNDQVKWSANGYRLPTEAEWEKAARGGLTGKRFPLGDTISHTQAHYIGSRTNYTYDYSGRNGYNPIYDGIPSPVGAFSPNGYGIYGMAGNMEEWCWDWYGAYAAGSQTNPLGAGTGVDRVLRGGSFTFQAPGVRVASRRASSPTSSVYHAGFRVVSSSVP